jgi:hypothetical protein
MAVTDMVEEHRIYISNVSLYMKQDTTNIEKPKAEA